MKEKVFFNNETIKLISLFEKVTRSKLLDCFEDKNGLLIFVVEEGELKKALGKQVENIKKLEGMLKRKIRVIEFKTNITNFIKSLIFPMKIRSVDVGNYDGLEEDEKHEAVISIEAENTKTRGIIIGRGGTNLRNYEAIIKKYYPIKELKVS